VRNSSAGQPQRAELASQEEVEAAFAGWQMLAVEPADTAGLGWPMNKTAPQRLPRWCGSRVLSG
jgi:hypothetical protein